MQNNTPFSQCVSSLLQDTSQEWYTISVKAEQENFTRTLRNQATSMVTSANATLEGNARRHLIPSDPSIYLQTSLPIRHHVNVRALHHFRLFKLLFTDSRCSGIINPSLNVRKDSEADDSSGVELTNRPPKESRHLSYIQSICIDITATIHLILSLILSKVPTFVGFILQQLIRFFHRHLAHLTPLQTEPKVCCPDSHLFHDLWLSSIKTGCILLRLICVACSHLEIPLHVTLRSIGMWPLFWLVVASHLMSPQILGLVIHFENLPLTKSILDPPTGLSTPTTQNHNTHLSKHLTDQPSTVSILRSRLCK